MAANGVDFSEPLLDTAQAGVHDDDDDDNGHERQRLQWWDKVLDVNEAKNQILFSCPMILTNLFYYIITLVSVMLAGHLGDHQLAAATLANSWATVTGFAFMTGLSGALETLCGQGYGAKLYRMLGINLQASCMISFVFSIFISLLWYFTDYVLVFLHQDPEISKTASLYMKYLIPGLFAYGVLQNIVRFLQAQSILKPLALLSSVAVVLHVGLTYVLVNLTSLGFTGAPLAASISLWIATIMLAMYVRFASRCKHTWEGFSSESLSFVVPNLRLAMPSAAMVCLEYWAFEILVFLAGLMPNAEKSTSIVAICVNTESIAYMITYGLSAAASTRVSNELGADRPKQAKAAMLVTVKLSLLLALIMVVALAFGHNIWAGFFTSSPSLLKEFASMTPFLAISLTIDSVQGVLSGAARGCGWQSVAVYVNLATFYFIGIAIASLLGFKLKLYAKGLWIGMICGLSCQATTLLLILLRKNWTRSELSTKKEHHDRAAV